MNKGCDQKRIGFHSIESIIENNPHKIKKLFMPYSREDSRIKNLIEMADKNGIKYEVIEPKVRKMIIKSYSDNFLK